jgi:putative transposase
MVTPYARTKAVPAGRAGTGILIPVTNVIESVFATVRHRTVRTKGSLSPTTARLMVFKLVMAASKTWRRLKGTNQLPKVIAGVRFNDGIEVIQLPANHAA